MGWEVVWYGRISSDFRTRPCPRLTFRLETSKENCRGRKWQTTSPSHLLWKPILGVTIRWLQGDGTLYTQILKTGVFPGWRRGDSRRSFGWIIPHVCLYVKVLHHLPWPPHPTCLLWGTGWRQVPLFCALGISLPMIALTFWNFPPVQLGGREMGKRKFGSS